MADEKRELSKEEQEAVKRVEEAVKPEIKDEDKVQIKNLSDEIIDDTKDAIETENQSSEDESQIKPKGTKNKNLIAKNKIEETKNKVQKIEEEVQKTIEEVKAKIADFEDYEANVLNNVISRAKTRLKDIGFEEPEDEVVLPKVKIDTAKDVPPLNINDISTGVGSSFVSGLVGALATVAGWCIYVSRLQDVPFPPHKLPQVPEMMEKAKLISTSLGLEADPMIGAGIVGGSALVVFTVIYKSLVTMKASKNLEISKKLEQDAKEYSKKRLQLKDMVLKISEHIDELRHTTEEFEVLLDEKGASLRRAKAFENVDSFDKLHEKTKETAKDTHELIVELEKLLAAPMAKDAVLNEESLQALQRADELITKQVKKIYN
jgi:hypothetical protein